MRRQKLRRFQNHIEEDELETQVLRMQSRLKMLDDMVNLNAQLNDPGIAKQVLIERKTLATAINEMQKKYGVSLFDLYGKIGAELLRGQLLDSRDKDKERKDKLGEEQVFDLVDEDKAIDREIDHDEYEAKAQRHIEKEKKQLGLMPGIQKNPDAWLPTNENYIKSVKQAYGLYEDLGYKPITQKPLRYEQKTREEAAKDINKFEEERKIALVNKLVRGFLGRKHGKEQSIKNKKEKGEQEYKENKHQRQQNKQAEGSAMALQSKKERGAIKKIQEKKEREAIKKIQEKNIPIARIFAEKIAKLARDKKEEEEKEEEQQTARYITPNQSKQPHRADTDYDNRDAVAVVFGNEDPEIEQIIGVLDEGTYTINGDSIFQQLIDAGADKQYAKIVGQSFIEQVREYREENFKGSREKEERKSPHKNLSVMSQGKLLQKGRYVDAFKDSIPAGVEQTAQLIASLTLGKNDVGYIFTYLNEHHPEALYSQKTKAPVKLQALKKQITKAQKEMPTGREESKQQQ